jgi:hypothetical protein
MQKEPGYGTASRNPVCPTNLQVRRVSHATAMHASSSFCRHSVVLHCAGSMPLRTSTSRRQQVHCHQRCAPDISRNSLHLKQGPRGSTDHRLSLAWQSRRHAQDDRRVQDRTAAVRAGTPGQSYRRRKRPPSTYRRCVLGTLQSAPAPTAAVIRSAPAAWGSTSRPWLTCSFGPVEWTGFAWQMPRSCHGLPRAISMRLRS